ncbi:MAG TPA: hypothetical protein VMJ35_07625 [Dongiaceae bacterium]|nr:hypothetical protein [Dongiaceae bacterium]
MKQPSETQVKKKPYQAPKLLVYGTLTQLTQNVGIKGHLDGGSQLLKRRTGR